MTKEEALEFGKVWLELQEDCKDSNKYEFFKMAISDIEKNIPKKPIPIDYKQYVGVIRNAEYLRNRSWCPNCHTDIKSGRYCVNCGQLLDWR